VEELGSMLLVVGNDVVVGNSLVVIGDGQERKL